MLSWHTHTKVGCVQFSFIISVNHNLTIYVGHHVSGASRAQQQQQRCTIIVATSPLNTACISSTVCLYHICKVVILQPIYVLRPILRKELFILFMW